MKPGSAPYRAGEQVWVNQGGVFARATLASNASRRGSYTDIEVAYPDGRRELTSVQNVHRDSPAMASWLAATAEESGLLRALTEVCERQGFTYGGRACQATPEWAAYQANRERARAAGEAAFAVHPYSR